MPQGALSEAEVNTLRSVASRNSRAFGGPERRNSPEPRVFFEVDIGLSSESNFYAGLTSDVSSGGVFVCTHQPAASGSEVTLFFVLPSGYSVEVTGVVRWTRTASEDSAPGMGVAFTHLKAADLAAIAEYCGYRAPLFHENE
ncbi:MAG TPA: TIGR02266 family protein [Polyangiaceae bacterium]